MEDNIIKLIDEEGQEIEFEVVMTLEAGGNEYAILIPLDGDDEEAYIFRIDTIDDEDVIVPIENEDEYQMVLEAYEELMEDEE